MVQGNKYKVAVGLHYQGDRENVPSVSVKGDLLLADKVVELAKRFGVSVVENSELARALNALELDQAIPEELYKAVAIVLNQIENKGK